MGRRPPHPPGRQHGSGPDRRRPLTSAARRRAVGSTHPGNPRVDVVTFDEVEYQRWLQTAGDHLRVARHDAEGRFHSAAVLQAEQATQCALKALLHGVGHKRAARGHGLLSLAEACEGSAGLVLNGDDGQALARLARDYQPTRYPDALPEGTPMGHYGEQDAEWALEIASRIVEAVEATWDRLMQETGGGRA
ncbi:MAG: HEPN domain-containing protein [Nitriliruptorales bacterium]|nr:HEPN domain-containing protein [Nitriliruptorales bacterium]